MSEKQVPTTLKLTTLDTSFLAESLADVSVAHTVLVPTVLGHATSRLQGGNKLCHKEKWSPKLDTLVESHEYAKLASEIQSVSQNILMSQDNYRLRTD